MQRNKVQAVIQLILVATVTTLAATLAGCAGTTTAPVPIADQVDPWREP